jgi:hypothetical protein
MEAVHMIGHAASQKTTTRITETTITIFLFFSSEENDD